MVLDPVASHAVSGEHDHRPVEEVTGDPVPWKLAKRLIEGGRFIPDPPLLESAAQIPRGVNALRLDLMSSSLKGGRGWFTFDAGGDRLDGCWARLEIDVQRASRTSRSLISRSEIRR